MDADMKRKIFMYLDALSSMILLSDGSLATYVTITFNVNAKGDTGGCG